MDKTINSNHKTCPLCGIEKQLSEFYNRRGKQGNSAYCKHCNNQKVVERIRRNKLRAIEYLGGRCMSESCQTPVVHPAAFDFHHRDPLTKDTEIKRLLNRSWDKIVVELDKCALLCSNCHRTFHATQTNNAAWWKS